MTETTLKRREVEWHDPKESFEKAATMSGLEYMLAMGNGEIPMAPIGELMNMRGVSASEGEAVFAFTPDESMVNPLGIVHGGPICTLLDSVIGCAVHTTLPAGVGYTSIDINVSFLRPPQLGVELTAIGKVTKPGRRVAFGEGELRDPDGKLVAKATSSCLIFGG
jgi:uncharacterized protein (TIGR00369 family)